MRALTITESAQNILSNKDITELSDFWNGKITENSVTVFFDENLDIVTDEYIYTLNIIKDDDEYTFTVSTDKEIISSTTLTIHKPLIREVTP